MAHLNHHYRSHGAATNVLQSIQTTGGTPYTFSYTYNLAGALKTETYPDNRVLTTTYDGANRPFTLSGSLSGQRHELHHPDLLLAKQLTLVFRARQ